MKNVVKKLSLPAVMLFIFTTGCANMDIGNSQGKKQNAWIHHRTTALAAEKARAENSSENLRQLTSLSSFQSNAFLADYGLPEQIQPIDTVEDALSQTNWNIAQNAIDESNNKMTAWDIADNIIELSIAVASLFGGVYGIKLVSYFREAREKSKALQEIIYGNELLKKQGKSTAAAFKIVHQNQSPQTKQIVAQIKHQKT
ncbi:MAG: hypothetical protein K8R02_02770 [Anaerohalosphaeraceae bacterium]|nr:hypothetical protein [Anaerohalosphaeraceae bacterium]